MRSKQAGLRKTMEEDNKTGLEKKPLLERAKEADMAEKSLRYKGQTGGKSRKRNGSNQNGWSCQALSMHPSTPFYCLISANLHKHSWRQTHDYLHFQDEETEGWKFK